ncbi:MAG: 2-oxo acid dehydrogenase subunit E2 [Desulfobacterales bacterium]|nr:MAG: 2-oxo acid dehydrogenase subunit E2 [Desulfobacterales bacterium]
MAKIMDLPKLGVNMEKAKIIEWVAQVGAKVELDQPLVAAETDKALVEIPATVAGILAKQLAQVGETVACGEPLAVFVEPGEELPADFSIDQAALSLLEKTQPTAPVPVAAPTSAASEAQALRSFKRVKISPRAKRTARQMGIDYTLVAPSKPGARITYADVRAYAENLKVLPNLGATVPGPAPPPTADRLTVKKTIPLDGIRGTIAERLWQSTQATARAVMLMKVDVTAMTNWRQDLKSQGYAVSFNSLLVAVASKALSEFPEFNARVAGREIQLIEEINVGVAVDTARGLLVPTIRGADKRGVISIDIDFKEKVERAKAGRSTLDDLAGGTFTITNLGMFGVEAFIPIINPPEAAILALGEVNREQVILDDDSMVIRPLLRLSLVWDHRINDGAPAARFLSRIKQIMEWPMALLN